MFAMFTATVKPLYTGLFTRQCTPAAKHKQSGTFSTQLHYFYMQI